MVAVAVEADPNELLDEPEAAVVLKVKPETLQIWRSSRRYNLPYIKVGRLIRYKRCHLEAFLEARTVYPNSRAVEQPTDDEI